MNGTATASTPATDSIDTRTLVSELNSYLAAYASASSAPLALSSATASKDTANMTSTLLDPTSQLTGELPSKPHEDDGQEVNYTEALTSLLSTLETRRASVRAHMSRLVRNMAEQLELNGGAGAGGRQLSSSGAMGLGRASLGRKSVGGGFTGGAMGGAALMGAVEDLQREAERCLLSLDAIPIREEEADPQDELVGANGDDLATSAPNDSAGEAGRSGVTGKQSDGSSSQMQLPP
ncbi:hypothetical protein A4X13_0g5763 [Tilletia indica]|uniref:Uncharacterized protein n=1 Tax=Tilletia indica TaxID=43049 RepID=A0A177T6V7_9BASI|nr:hypothetical protein A4X13_0g5763 [Tilletia indica]